MPGESFQFAAKVMLMSRQNSQMFQFYYFLLKREKKIHLCVFNLTVLYSFHVSMYHNVKYEVKFNNHLSEEFTNCGTGIRQSECLSPFLFAIYVNVI